MRNSREHTAIDAGQSLEETRVYNSGEIDETQVVILETRFIND